MRNFIREFLEDTLKISNEALEECLRELLAEGYTVDDLVIVRGTPSDRIKDIALRHSCMKADVYGRETVLAESWVCLKRDMPMDQDDEETK